jgi:fatty-acyl-CoA synthase
MSYQQLKELSDSFSAGLMQLGVTVGDHVITWMPNIPEWNVSLFGISRAGAVVVPVNSRYKSFELEHILRNSDATTLIMVDSLLGIDFLEILHQVCPEVAYSSPGNLKSEAFPYLRNVIVLGDSHPGCFGFSEVVDMGAKGPCSYPAVDPKSVGVMFYTSGTTGFPKGCLICYEAARFFCQYACRVMSYSATDVILAVAPYFHMFGLFMHLLTSVMSGARQVIMTAFHAGEALELIEGEGVTIFNGIPTMFISCFAHPDFGRRNLKSLRIGMVGGAPCPLEVMKKIMDKEAGMGMEAINAYALTESGGPVTFTGLEDSYEKRTTTIGRAIEGVEIKVMDPNTAQELPHGELGEIWIKSPGNMLGYYKNSQATSERIVDGWLRTGDLAISAEDGYLKLTGRLSDVIITGGFNVYPREIEEFLHTHPGVQEVAAVGVPDESLGEVAMVCIVPKKGETITLDKITSFYKGQLASYKVPRYLEVAESLPMAGVGKVQKFKLRQRAIEKYGLREVP